MPLISSKQTHHTYQCSLLYFFNLHQNQSVLKGKSLMVILNLSLELSYVQNKDITFRKHNQFVYSCLKLKRTRVTHSTLNFSCTFKKQNDALIHLTGFLKKTKRLEHLAFYSSAFSLKPCCLNVIHPRSVIPCKGPGRTQEILAQAVVLYKTGYD